jgi:uncharacterized membrane protein YfcA
MLLAARATWVRAGHAIPQAVGCPDAEARVLVPAGAAVGALTGLVGVGGGFLIVPALAIGLSFGMREAMATSMAIVTLVSLAGLASHLAAGNSLDVDVAAVMGAATVAGALAGPAIAARLSLRTLGRGFTLLILMVAVGIAAATLAGANPA